MKLFRLLEDLQFFHGSSSQITLYLRKEGTAAIILIYRGMCSSFRRVAGAGSAAFPPPNPQTAPCGRGTSRQDEKTCARSNWRPLSLATSQKDNKCRDSSTASHENLETHSTYTHLT